MGAECPSRSLEFGNHPNDIAKSNEVLQLPQSLARESPEAEQYAQPPTTGINNSAGLPFDNDLEHSVVDSDDASDYTSELTNSSGSDWDAISEEYGLSEILSQGFKAFGNEVIRRATTEIEALWLCADTVISCCGPNGPSTCSCVNHQDLVPTVHTNTSRLGKRQQGTGDPDDAHDDEEDEQDKRRKLDQSSLPNIFPGVHYACPYFKQDPEKDTCIVAHAQVLVGKAYIVSSKPDFRGERYSYTNSSSQRTCVPLPCPANYLPKV